MGNTTTSVPSLGNTSTGVASVPGLTTTATPGSTATPTVGLQYTPNQQVAPLTDQQLQAMQGVSAETQPTQNFLNTTLGEQNYIAGGGLLSPQSNPYLSQYYNAMALPMVQNYQQAIAPNILQQAAQTGTLGSAGMDQAFGNAESSLAQGLGNLGAQIGNNAYNTGVGATMQAGANAPSLASAQYTPSTELAQSGQVGQQQAQNVLNTAYNNLYASGQSPFTLLNQLGTGLNTASGGGTSGISIGTSPSTASGK